MKILRLKLNASELAFLSENRTMIRRELFDAFIEEFGRADITFTQMKSLCKHKGWLTGRSGHFEKGDDPTRGRFVKGNVSRSQFKKGHHLQPKSISCPGHEYTREGYIMIRIEEADPRRGTPYRFVLKHRLLWEKTNGPVPEGMILKCLGEKANCEPTNWEVIPRGVLARISAKSEHPYDQAPDELKPAIMAVAKLKYRLKTIDGKSS